MVSESYDVLVVGAGPAGAMAAKSAADEGAEVLMIDKRRELGVPVQCGEALAEDVLYEFGIDPDPCWTVNKIDSTMLVSPSGDSVKIEQKSVGKPGYILDRKIFDKHLAVRAVRAGSDIEINTFVDGLIEEDGEIKGLTFTSDGGEGEVRGDVVIAADGVMSMLARKAGFDTSLGPEDIESGAQFKMVGVDIDEKSRMDFYFGSEIAPGGYVWVFPRGDDSANVGIGVLPEKSEKRPIEYLKDFISSRPGLKDGKVVEVNVGGVPISGPLERTVDDSIIVGGDAARQVNSLTGGGIDWSMRAGDIAGEVAARAVSEGDTSENNLQEYEERWQEEMGESLAKYYEGKEVLLDLSDDELDDLAGSLQSFNFEEISLTKMLKVLINNNPKLMWKLKGLM